MTGRSPLQRSGPPGTGSMDAHVPGQSRCCRARVARPGGRGAAGGRDASPSTASPVRDVIEYRVLSDEPEVALDLLRGGSSCALEVAKDDGDPARGRGRLAAVRPGAHLRQPLRVLLHLPAAAGHAAEPVPEGRRLPAVVPLRELHHPHPLHRGRPRAGRHRGPVAAVRQRSTPPTPTVRVRPAAQPPGRHQPALAAGPARPRRRGPRPGRRLPGPERRRRARRHAGRRARPYPELADVCVVPLGHQPLQHRAAHARPHRRPRPRAVVDAVEAWQDVFLAVARSPPRVHAADEYYLLAGRPFPDAGGLRGLPHARGRHRHGPHLRARVRGATPTTGIGAQPGFFAWVDGAPAEGYRAPALRTPTPAARPDVRRRGTGGRAVPLRPGAARPVGILTGTLRRRRARAARRRARPRRRPRDPGREPVLRRQHRRHRPDGRRGPRPGAGRRSPRATATCCPTSASPSGRFLDGTSPDGPAPTGRGRPHRRRRPAPALQAARTSRSRTGR